MPRAVTLADFRPAERADGQPWIEVRIEETDDPAGKWSEVKSTTLEPVDEDPSEPSFRSFTTGVEKAWVRLVFLDAEGNEDAPCPMVYVAEPQFRPTVAQIAGILKARTYDMGGDGLAGGDLLEEFGDDTRPSAEYLEAQAIPQACIDVDRAVGPAPGFLLDDKRRVAAFRAAAESERSYIPESTEETQPIYQTLRMTYEEQAKELRQRLQWWALTKELKG
jgi:hypothetical protein